MRDRGSRRVSPGSGLRFLICVALVGSIGTIGAMAFLYRSADHMASHHGGLVVAANQIRLEATLAHLWLEEVLSGDHVEDISKVWDHFDRADGFAKALLEGGTDWSGPFLPVEDPLLRRQIQGLRLHLAELRSTAEGRNQARDSLGPGSDVDQVFDKLFASFMDRAEAVESALHSSLHDELSSFRRTQLPLMAAVFLLGLGASVVFYRFNRRRSEDHSRLHAALTRAEQSEKRFHDLVYSMADWVWEVDAAGAFTFCSENVLGFLGYTPAEIAGRLFWDLVAEPDAHRVQAVFEKAAAERRPVCDVENWKLRRDGSRLCSWTSLVPLYDEAGSLLGFRGVDRDVTAKKRADEALERAETELRGKVTELAETNRELRQEMRERHRAELALRESRDFLRRVSAAFLEAEEVQRARIAHELREEVAQSCHAVKFALDEALGPETRKRKAASLEKVYRTLNDAAEHMSGISMELRPPMLDELGTLASLSWVCRSQEQLRPHVRVACEFDLDESDIPDRLKTPVFRVVEEALSALTSGGNPQNLCLEISCSPSELSLSLRREAPETGVADSSFLDNVRHRVELYGGDLNLDALDDSWTTMRMRWPRSPVEQVPSPAPNGVG